MMVAQCTENNFVNPFNGKTEVTRLNLLTICTFTDIVIVFSFILFLVFIVNNSRRSISEFKDFFNKIEVEDFAIQVTGLPPITEYKNEQILKVILWQHFEDIIKFSPQ